MKEPLVSVIIPASNEENYIKRALKSVKDQDYSNIEIIVVVNGSKDKTAEIASIFSKVLVFPERLGASRARNEGAKIAKGEILIFLDADSVKSKELVRIVVGATLPHTFGTVWGYSENKALKYRIFYLLKNLSHFFKLYRGVMGGVMFSHKNLFISINGFDERMISDELHDFSRRARSVGGQHVFLKKAHATTSMRRFERKGLFPMFFYWVKLRYFYLLRNPKLQGLFGQKYDQAD